jgi:hypothetical protein
MQTLYVVLAFLMMVALPFFIAQRGSAARDAGGSSLTPMGEKRRSD